MGISPIALTWLAREPARARIKALKDAAEFLGRDCRNDPASTRSPISTGADQAPHLDIEDRSRSIGF
jgi:hypothetical protein